MWNCGRLVHWESPNRHRWFHSCGWTKSMKWNYWCDQIGCALIHMFWNGISCFTEKFKLKKIAARVSPSKRFPSDSSILTIQCNYYYYYFDDSRRPISYFQIYHSPMAERKRANRDWQISNLLTTPLNSRMTIVRLSFNIFPNCFNLPGFFSWPASSVYTSDDDYLLLSWFILWLIISKNRCRLVSVRSKSNQSTRWKHHSRFSSSRSLLLIRIIPYERNKN